MAAGKDPAVLAFELQRNILGDILPELQPKHESKSVHFGTDKNEVEIKKKSHRSNGVASDAARIGAPPPKPRDDAHKKYNRRSQNG